MAAVGQASDCAPAYPSDTGAEGQRRRRNTTTFVAGLRRTGMVAPWVLDGPINGDAFTTYAARVLAPELKPGDVVIMDNLSSHKLSAVRTAIESAGARLLFLPPYTLRLLSNGYAAGTLAGSAPTSTQSSRPSPSSKRI